MIIYGAGLAGLLAGCMFQTAAIHEAAPPHTASHKALLRFRTRVVGEAIGIEFRAVCVRKGIWHQGQFREPTIQFANWYAKKATGQLMDRSIWDIASVERFIAPENLIEQLIDRCSARIQWNTPLTQLPPPDQGPYISTIPMNVMAAMAHPSTTIPFTYQPIVVKRWRLANSDVYQTIYVPDPNTTLYRVSITKDLVIAEYMNKADDYDFWRAFGLYAEEAEPLETTKQRFGKIAPISDQDLYGEPERWVYPTDAGDCEDYLLLKKRYLEGLGFPPEALLITVVLDEKTEGHAVLTVTTDGGDFILDNRRNDVLRWSDVNYTFLKRQSHSNPAQWMALVKQPTSNSGFVSGGTSR